jgi:hypothetical protein
MQFDGGGTDDDDAKIMLTNARLQNKVCTTIALLHNGLIFTTRHDYAQSFVFYFITVTSPSVAWTR